MMLNLIGEMAKRRISVNSLAETLEVHRNSVTNKLYGKSKFTVGEAIAIADSYFPDCDIRVLFRDSEGETTESA